jgi:hypothetical protein
MFGCNKSCNLFLASIENLAKCKEDLNSLGKGCLSPFGASLGSTCNGFIENCRSCKGNMSSYLTGCRIKDLTRAIGCL